MSTTDSSRSDPDALGAVAARIVADDRQRRSWREKLALVHELLASEGSALGRQDLVDVAVYLRFLAMGQLPCKEDGHHYRPSHHARIAQQVHEQLARLAGPDSAPILRKIYPWLPSFGPEFTRKEPLTRIRDIAHRNDIPQQLKREIKCTLQNKLHRCAGPEDLATSAALLERVTAEGADYSADFVEQLRIFHAELKEFFSARSLLEQVSSLAETVDDSEVARTLQRAADQLRVEDDESVDLGQPRPAVLLERLAALTRLREVLATQLVTDNAVQRQPVQLADIAAEERSFVVLSELNNALGQATADQSDWERALEALVLTLEQLRLSRTVPDEAGAVASDLGVWRQMFSATCRDDVLRVRAVVQRCRRLAGEQTDAVVGLFTARVETLGRALGVPLHAIATFCEAELRANLLFQLTRTVRWLDRQVRKAVGLSPWVPLVPGQVGGKLLRVQRVGDVKSAAGDRLIALVEAVEGDETLPEQLAGLIVCHELPQLSHLAVRARQHGIPAATIDDPQAHQELARLLDRTVRLRVWDDGVDLAASPVVSVGAGSGPAAERAVAVFRVERLTGDPVVTLCDAPVAAVGTKAASLVRLQQIARDPAAGFGVPDALVVVLGAMEAALQQQPDLAATYARLVARAEGAPAAELPGICEQLRSLIRRLSAPAKLGERVSQTFTPTARLMVRSSANCEDLAQLSGAGLYDSVANVSLSKAGLAVRSVWASLWTDRAALARRADGIPQADAQMAVLVQQMVDPDWSFFMHTVDPVTGNPDDALVELVVGLGETLASASRGTPLRWTCSKTGEQTTVVAYPSLSEGLWPDGAGGLRRQIVQYAHRSLCQRDDLRQRLGRQLGQMAALLERELGVAQDVEGVIQADALFVVQARAQQGVKWLRGAGVREGERPRKQPQRAATAQSLPATAALAAQSGEVTETVSPVGARASEGEPEPQHAKMAGVALKLPRLLALFEKLIAGDDALLELARRRCAEKELGIEIHPAEPAAVDHLLGFRPAGEACVTAHLPRQLDLLRPDHHDAIAQFARAAAGRVRGLVVHDQKAIVRDPDHYRDAVARLDERLGQIAATPLLFVEYAVGLEPADFVGFFESIRSLERVSACVDSGHIGIRQLCKAYAAGSGPELRPCSLTPYDERLPAALPALEEARQSCLPVVVETVRELVALQKPLHFHLHDGHPLWTLSPYGVSDHMSFLERISIPFAFEGQSCLPPLFGPDGLAAIVSAALGNSEPDLLSMTLEIHPVPGRRKLGAARELFRHWQDKENAERMNYWLAVVAANATCLRQAVS